MFTCESCKNKYDFKYLEQFSKYNNKNTGKSINMFTCIYCSAKREDERREYSKRTEHWNKLSEKYPRIFNRYYGRDILGNEVLIPSNAAGGVGDGWFNLIKETAEKIQEELDKIGPESFCSFYQMKEKFGGLRWYTSTPFKPTIYNRIAKIWNFQILVSYNKYIGKYVTKYKLYKFRLPYPITPIQEIIDKAEELSYTICEVCGEPGKTRTTGWHMTLCDKHAIERGYIKEKIENE